jgi:hypothetical protein
MWVYQRPTSTNYSMPVRRPSTSPPRRASWPWTVTTAAGCRTCGSAGEFDTASKTFARTSTPTLLTLVRDVMTDRQNGPPESEVPAPEEPAPTTTPTVDSPDHTRSGRQSAYHVLAGTRRRREHVVRSEGGDPDHPNDRRYHRPPTGLRAAGFRDGYRRGMRRASGELWSHLDADGRAIATQLVAQAETAADE